MGNEGDSLANIYLISIFYFLGSFLLLGFTLYIDIPILACGGLINFAVAFLSFFVINILYKNRKKKNAAAMVDRSQVSYGQGHVEHIKVKCPHCLSGQTISGVRPFQVSCRSCGVSLMIPAKKGNMPNNPSFHPPEMLKLQCPHCGRQQAIRERQRPFEVSCESCGVTLLVPVRKEPGDNRPVGYDPLIVTSIDHLPGDDSSLSIDCPDCGMKQITKWEEPYLVRCTSCNAMLELPMR